MRDEGPWQGGAQASAPASGEAHLWRVELIAAMRDTSLRQTLDAADRQRSAQLQPPAREAFETTRGALRRILGGYLQRDPASLRFESGSRGKPTLAGAARGELRFNISHSAEYALLAITSGREVGVDIERVRPVRRMRRITSRLFHPATHSWLEQLNEPERSLAFAAAWTQLEAHVKAMGAGIFDANPRLACVWPIEAQPLVHLAEPVADSRWTIIGWQPADGYAGACVVEGAVTHVRLLE
jgi:4'-phosphopantetheinyl transferase